MEFTAIGDNCIDYYVQSNMKYAGGNAVNVAVYMKELSGQAAYFGVVGNDENGSIIIDALQAKGVETSSIRMAEGKTAVTEVRLVNGDRVLGNYDEGVLADFSITPEELEAIKRYRFIHTAVWGKCEKYLEELHRNSIISYDFADKHEIDFLTGICKHIDYGFISYTKDDDFIRTILKKMCDQQVKVAVATLGENGSIAYDGTAFYSCGINQVEVIDTLGAGDSFIAGFMYGISQNLSIAEALQAGTDRASKTIQYFGAW